MPEINEVLTHYLHLMFALRTLLVPADSTRVVGFWFDSMDGKNEPTDSSHRKGLVGRLEPQEKKDLPIRMGESLWPSSMTLEQVKTLRLTNLEWNARCVYFRFEDAHGTEKWMSARFYTHTSVQVYSCEQWHESLIFSKKELRGFRIQFAIEFEKYVISFNTLDKLCQIKWTNSRSQLPGSSWPNILDNWRGYLTAVVEWRRESIRTKTPEARASNFVIDALRKIPFAGIGVYTGSEICHIAGIPPFISESAAFDDPVILARLFEGQYYIVRNHHDRAFPKMVRPCIHDGVLAPTQNQRMEYGKRNLYVHGMECVKVPQRQMDLMDAYTSHFSEHNCPPTYDFFEPSLIKDYIGEPGHLGNLIFGNQWPIVRPPKMKPDREPDPITAEFFPQTVIVASRNSALPQSVVPLQRYMDEWFTKASPSAALQKVNQPRVARTPGTRAPIPYARAIDYFDTRLNLSLYTSYDDTFVDVKADRFASVHAGRHNGKDFWSVVPVPHKYQTTMIPHKTKGEVALARQYTAQEQSRLLFRNLVKKTRVFAVGPLEYCGSGFAVKPLKGEGGGKKIVVLTYRFDTLPNQNLVHRFLGQREGRDARWDDFVAESKAIFHRRDNWRIFQIKAKVLRAVEIMESYLLFKVRLRYLAKEGRRVRQVRQYEKEQEFLRRRTREFCLFDLSSLCRTRTTPLGLIYKTWHIRELHFVAWPDLYPNKKLPPKPLRALTGGSQANKPGGTTWRDDIEIEGYPSILADMTPYMTSYRPDPTPSPSPSSPEKHQTFLGEWFAIQRLTWAENGWLGLSPPSSPTRPPPARKVNTGFATAVACALYRGTPFPPWRRPGATTTRPRATTTTTKRPINNKQVSSTAVSTMAKRAPPPSISTNSTATTTAPVASLPSHKKRKYVTSDVAVIKSDTLLLNKRTRVKTGLEK